MLCSAAFLKQVSIPPARPGWWRRQTLARLRRSTGDARGTAPWRPSGSPGSLSCESRALRRARARTIPARRARAGAATICSLSLAGTLGSFNPCAINIGLAILSTWFRGEMRSRKSRMSGSRLIAVFHAPQIAPIALRVLQERDEVADAHTLDAGRQAIAEMHHRGEHHVAAVGPAGHGDAFRVEVVPGSDPVEQRTDILHAVLSQVAVVEFQVRLAVARGTAHVGCDNRDAQFVDEELRRGGKPGPILAFGTAVDVQQHGMRDRRRAADRRMRGSPGRRTWDSEPVPARPWLPRAAHRVRSGSSGSVPCRQSRGCRHPWALRPGSPRSQAGCRRPRISGKSKCRPATRATEPGRGRATRARAGG